MNGDGRLDVRAGDGARLTLTRHQDGRVSLSVGQCPDRTVAVRLPAAQAARVGAWLDNTGHATVSGVVLRDQTAADLGIGASGDDAYRSGPAGDTAPDDETRGYACGACGAVDEWTSDELEHLRAELEIAEDALAFRHANVRHLRSEAAALRDAGNALAGLVERWFNSFPEPLDPTLALDTWRSAASPTDGA